MVSFPSSVFSPRVRGGEGAAFALLRRLDAGPDRFQPASQQRTETSDREVGCGSAAGVRDGWEGVFSEKGGRVGSGSFRT